MSEPNQPRILFASTNYGPMWAPAVESFIACVGHTQRRFHMEFPWPKGEVCGTAITDRTYTHSAGNNLVDAFLKADPKLTHIFLTENDMILPHDTIIKLLEVDQPIVSGVYFLRKGRGQACLYVKTYVTKENPYVHSPVSIFPENRPFALDPKGHGGCPGLGCVLIKREVFEKIPFPWFDLKESNYGSDMYFFTKVRDAGFDVWVNPEVMCGQIEYTTTSIHDYHQRMQEDPHFAASGYIVGTNGWSGAHRRIQPESGGGAKQ